MSDRMAAGSVTVSNPEGLHLRPAEMFVRLARQFEAEIEVRKDQTCVDGKSILDIITLFAGQGARLSIRAIGRDAPEALKALRKLVEGGFAEIHSSEEA